MKRHFAPSLVALSFCALLGGARAANAQSVEAIVPTAIDSIAPARAEPGVPASVGAATTPLPDLRPLMRPASPILLRHVDSVTNDDVLARELAVQGRSWKMPTSRTLMIGGVVAVIVGLAAVKGDTGAVIALAGGGVAVYGLYLHYNR